MRGTVPGRGRTLVDITERLPERTDGPTVVQTRHGNPVVEPSETHAVIELETADEVWPRRRLHGVLALVAVLACLAVLGRVRSPVVGVPVSVSSQDERVQWIRLADGAGVPMLSARTAASGRMADGAYELSAKVIGWPIARRAIVVDRGLELGCSSAGEGRVVCSDRARRASYLLIP